MKITITGANEFVGAFFCRYFHATGHQITAIGHKKIPNPELLKFAGYLQADILKPIEVFDSEVCIHAANYHTESAIYQELFLNHVEGTLNVVEAARFCSHLVHISSSAVYEFGDKPVKETDAHIEAGLSDYGETKLLAEEVLGFNIPVMQKRMILRPRAIYGVGDAVFLPKLFNLLKRRTIFCPVDKKVNTSLTHVENIAYAIELFLKHENEDNLQIYNVADEPVYSICDSITELLSAIEERPLEMVNLPVKALNAIEKVYSKLDFIKHLNPAILKSIHQNSVLDLDCIHKNLHYKPIRNLQNSIAEIAAWIKSVGGKKGYTAQLSAVPWLK